MLTVPSPLIDLVAFALPKSEVEKVPQLTLFLDSVAGAELEFIRGVTLAMEIPAAELKHVSVLHSQ